MSRRTYTDTELAKAWHNSADIAEVLTTLGLVPRGANYASIRHHAKRLGLSESQLTPMAKVINPSSGEIRLSEKLTKGTRISNQQIKSKLIDLGIFSHMCCKCGIVEFHGIKVPLELEHINGDTSDNRLENLTLLCPNCHSQTDTYAGRNAKKN